MTGRRADQAICLVLLAGTVALYSAVRHFQFVDFDDPDYALAPRIRDGFTRDAVKWAFTSGDSANWLPVTRLSHLADYQLYGPQSGPAHQTSVAIHALASVMLFLFLLRATGARYKSAFVAAVFAWHPLHVESVAWVAERKDVLCALFWFLTLWLWVRYAERPGRARYLITLGAFCLGLMSKPMMVTLPFVMLLVDLWPLRRKFSGRLVVEKAPFLALAAGASVVTYMVQGGAGAVGRLETFPLGLRLENVLLSYAIYAVRTFWPSHLAFWYPYPVTIPWWLVALCAAGLTAVCAAAIRYRKDLPWLATGWFWFLGTLVPVIGLVQVGSQARADRYMYIPMTGLLIVVAWGAEAMAVRRPRLQPHARLWLAGAGVGVCAALIPLTWFQIRTWQDSRTLFTHATRVTDGNYVAYNNLGTLAEKTPGREAEAREFFRTARRIKPDFAPAWYNLGRLDLLAGNIPEATRNFEEALRIRPDYGDAQNNLGVALGRQGRWQEAVPHLEAASRFSPKLAEAQRNLGEALIKTGRIDEAIESLENAVTLAPRDASAHNMLGFALAGKALRMQDAISHLREAIEIDPSLASAHANLGRLLSQLPNRQDEAKEELRMALKLNPGDRGTEAFLAGLERNPAR